MFTIYQALTNFEINLNTTTDKNTEGCSESHHRLHYWRHILTLALSLFLMCSQTTQATETIISAARVGMADYSTRITLESADQPIHYELSMLSNPERIVIDLENVALNQVIKTLPDKVDPVDPLIERIRYGQFKSHIVRLVFDLKTDVVPRTFLLLPVDRIGHRLVLDIHHPDKAAIAENEAGAETERPAINSGEDELGQFVASLIKKKPVQPDQNGMVGQLPKGYYAAKRRKPVPKRIITVAIDPGHGGHDSGAIGEKGAKEKDITLAISRKLKAIIDQEPHMRAILTRDSDYFIPLSERQAIARRQHADFFVSIHADGSPKPHAKGSSVYTLSEHGATSTTASWLAQKENSVDGNLVGGVDVASKSGDMREIILDLSMSATINDSVKAAGFILNQLGQINQLHKKTVEQAGFVVLKSPDIPSILVETAFITNPSEEKKLKTKNYQKKMAHAIFAGIKNYFDTNPALARTEMAKAQ